MDKDDDEFDWMFFDDLHGSDGGGGGGGGAAKRSSHRTAAAAENAAASTSILPSPLPSPSPVSTRAPKPPPTTATKGGKAHAGGFAVTRLHKSVVDVENGDLKDVPVDPAWTWQPHPWCSADEVGLFLQGLGRGSQRGRWAALAEYVRANGISGAVLLANVDSVEDVKELFADLEPPAISTVIARTIVAAIRGDFCKMAAGASKLTVAPLLQKSSAATTTITTTSAGAGSQPPSTPASAASQYAAVSAANRAHQERADAYAARVATAEAEVEALDRKSVV